MYSAAAWDIPSDFLSRSHFERVVAKLDWTSSPGYPYLLRAPTNGDYFRVKEGIPDPAVLEHVWSVVQQRLYHDQPADPIRLFVKPEAHTAKKLAEERYRLISSVSVIDQLIDHMLFGDMNDKLIENWFDVPSKPGWSMLLGGWRFMPRETWIATDASAWDWTVRSWLLELVLELRIMLCNNMNPEWLRLAKQRYVELYAHPVFITSGGVLLRQRTPGVLKSGCVNTISDNSMMQALLHIRVCSDMGIAVPYLFTMGDDRLQEPMDRQAEYYDLTASFCILKSVTKVNEFAGFRFQGGRVEPVHRGKHAFNILHADEQVLPELAASYVLNYHRSCFRDWFEKLFNAMEIELPSRQFRDLVWDGY